MKCFELHRDQDISGVSGTGIVAEGVEFSDGTVALKWIVGTHTCASFWNNIEDMQYIHGHEGATRIVYV